MKLKSDLLYKGPTQDAVAHLLAVGTCTAVLFLFVALTYSRITLPRYTTNYTEKDVQQVVNLIITVIATVIGILFSHCRRLTNEAETKAELRNDELTIPRLHVHFEAASGSKVAMGIPVARNKQVWRLVAFYFLAMIIFAFVHSVLSVIFVIDVVISDEGEPVPMAIPLSIDIPEYSDGVLVDPCAINIDSPGCAYILALQALSSQLITYQPYVIAGVTFEPPNGTMGLPYWAMDHFRKEVATIPFESARRRYCLPVLDPKTITCTEVPINHTTCESIDGSFVKFKSLNVSSYDDATDENNYISTGLYKITSPFPNPADDWRYTNFRIDSQGLGAMVVANHVDDPTVTLIGAANAWGEHGYASMMHKLMYDGAPPNTSDVPEGGTYDFAARCELMKIKDEDNLGSSWRQVDFTLKSGVLRANVTEERCPNARAPNGEKLSGFNDLTYALEGAGSIISSFDGYSKFFNRHPLTGGGTNIYAQHNMSRLDIIVNQIYAIVQTAWTESIHEYAMKVPAVTEQPITMTSYPHLFVIRISWTPTTYIGLVLAILIALNAWVLTARWVRATWRLGLGAETWDLLRPVDLMAYSLAASEDLLPCLDTVEHRRMEMRGTRTTVLKERPRDRIGVSKPQRTGSESCESTPVQEFYDKSDDPHGINVTVRQSDLESGGR